MNGFIANTDLDWHARLLAQAGTGRPHDEVSFWRPSTRPFKSLLPGEPFLFRLKSPANAIGGVGLARRGAVPEMTTEANQTPQITVPGLSLASTSRDGPLHLPAT